METNDKKSGFIEQMREWFITKEIFELRFNPIEKIVYGFAGLILIGFASALVVLIIKR